MKMKFTKCCAGAGVLVAAAAFFSSCCAIVNGSTQDVTINAKPSEARVFVDGVEYGKVPQIIPLRREKNHVVRIEAPGYAPYEVVLEHTYSNWLWGNVVFGGLAGLIIDYASGAIYTFDNMDVELVRKVRVSSTHGAPAGARKIGQMVRL